MSCQTHYIVQTAPAFFVRKDEAGVGSGMGREEASRLTIHEARRICRDEHKRTGGANGRRFPRILKITTEITTVNWR